jgi:hypothetical protein
MWPSTDRPDRDERARRRAVRPAGSVAAPMVGLVVGLALAAGLAPQVASAASTPTATSVTPTATSVSGQRLALPRVTRADLGHTRFGKTIYSANTSFSTALRRADSFYGHLDVVRVFYAGLPKPWPGSAGAVKRAVPVSFRGSPAAILSGRYDRGLRRWFAHAPRSHPVWWTYIHEPEDEIRAGDFSAASYRAAWRHLYQLSRPAHNPMLRPTLTLMCWTIEKGSGRRFSDYYPGNFIRTLAWDCYNQEWQQGRYRKPSLMITHAARFSHRRGKGFAIGEFGSPLVRGDSSGYGRARWLIAYAKTAARLRAKYVAYYDAPSYGCDMRLRDDPSRAAWRSIVRHS